MRSRLLAGTAALLLVSFGLLVFAPPTFAQVETVGDFLIKLARAAGLTPTNPSEAIAGLVSKNLLSASLGNVLTSQAALPLTKGAAARILAAALHDTQLQQASTVQDMVNVLAQRGIMTAGSADTIVTTEEATAILTNPAVAAAMSTAATTPAKPAGGHFPAFLPIALLLAAAAAAGGHGFSPASP
jgi:uncharacterized protein YutE (UPF0331/DUF86 family)